MTVILSESMIKSKQKGLKKYQERKRAELKKNGFKRKPHFQPRHEKQGATVSKQGDRAPQVRKTSQKPRKRIKPMSEKRAAQNKEYLKLRTEFLKKNRFCAVFNGLILATEVHHMKGKIGKLLTDTRFFLPVSRAGHNFIENNPAIAYKKGWSLKRLEK